MALHVSQRLSKHFREYEAYHGNQGNKLTHYLGIPMIAVSLLALLRGLSFTLSGIEINLAFVLCTGALLFYLRLDWRVALPFTAIVMAFYVMGGLMSKVQLWIFFALGWILQFIGHLFFEKKSPAFFTNLRHIFIGPLWIFAQLLALFT